ncbi:hypothetical protein F53441_13069 [Fusarium austroafricanum]|uniref:Uncharacterized protein n=1 Tax=Fusarium austroafricanum TaxID=2364996 RepID=A0A8H4JR40_9HYPO|nr:hypothetical protein F53441_13069 [Fusarium austroafricanum]
MKSSIALLVLAASVNASPLLKRQDDNGHVYDNSDTLCKDKAWLLGTPEGAAQVWKDTTADTELDIAIGSQWQHEVNWLKNLEDKVVGGVSGSYSSADCGVTDGSCDILGGMSCEDQFVKYGKDKDGNENVLGKTSYWIFKAVRGLQVKFRMLKTELTAQTMVTGFSIGSMVSDFQGNEDATADVIKWISAAIGLGETVAGLVPGISSGFETAAGILGGVFDIVAEEVKPEEIDTATISSALVSIFEKATEKIDNTLKLAVGGADNAEAFGALPDPTGGDTWYKSPVAKFFSTGWFLLDNDSAAVKNAIGSITNNIKPKIANNVMKTANLRLVADKRLKDREACGYATGRQWMALKEGEEYCFYLMRFNPSGMFGGSWTEATEDVYENMAKYNLGNRDPFYRGVIDCALSADKELKLDNLGFNRIPVCFFDLEAWFIDRNDDPQCNSPMVNKVCNPVKTNPIM